MVNPELDPGDSEVPADMRPGGGVAGHLVNQSSEYPTGKIRIEELLDTLACIECNAGLVIGIFAGLMMMIRHKEADVRMSRVPSQQTLEFVMCEAGMEFVSGFMFMGALGLFRKLHCERLNFIRKPCFVTATILTVLSLGCHFVSVFVFPGTAPKNLTPAFTKYTMCAVVTAFDLGIVFIALKVMMFNKFGEGFSEDTASPQFVSQDFAHNERTITGVQ